MPLIQKLELRRQLLRVGREACRPFILFFLRLSEDAEIWRVQRGELPVHPTLDLAACSGFAWIKRRAAGELVAQIAQDGVRLPDDCLAVHQRRHLAGRIEAQIFLRLGIVELTPVILSLVRLVSAPRATRRPFARSPMCLDPESSTLCSPCTAAQAFDESNSAVCRPPHPSRSCIRSPRGPRWWCARRAPPESTRRRSCYSARNSGHPPDTPSS